MTTILLQDTTDHHLIGYEFNRGAVAILVSTIAVMRRLIPDAEFVTFIQLSDSFSACHDIRVVNNRRFISRAFSLIESLKSWWLFLLCALWALLHKYLRINIGLLVNNDRLKEYYEAAIVLDVIMDHYNDEIAFIKVIEISRDLLLGVLLGKPVVIYAQSVGPFKGRLASWIARFALNRVSLITVREKISKGFLDEMAVNRPPIYVTADPAFLLESAPANRVTEILHELGVDSSKLLIGIGTPEGELLGGTKTWRGYKSVLKMTYHLLEYCLPERFFLWSMRLVRKSEYYSTLQTHHSGKTVAYIAQIADHLVEKTGASILLVPHYAPPLEYTEGEANGLVVAESILGIVSNKDKIIPVTGEYTTQEIKGIIGKCDLFISMKMHPTIAATSQCVPTIAIGTHPKFRGIMQMLGQERWVYDQIPEDMIVIVDDAWIHKEKIRKELETKRAALRDAALLNMQLVKQLLNSTPE
jgi:polysaccharide pyruvyl transferase WcaK-like protein